MLSTKTIIIAGAGIAAAVGLALAGASFAGAEATAGPGYGYGRTGAAPGAQGQPGYGAPGAPRGTGAANGTTDPSKPMRSDEQLLTGDTAAKVTAAAQAKEPGATIQRVETDSDGVYEAHLVRADGTQIVVQVGADFTVTAVQEHQGGGQGRWKGAGGTTGNQPPAGGSTDGRTPSASGSATSG